MSVKDMDLVNGHKDGAVVHGVRPISTLLLQGILKLLKGFPDIDVSMHLGIVNDMFIEVIPV